MSEETKDKRSLEQEAEAPSKNDTSTASNVKHKNKRRRRNYDDNDAEVAKEENTKSAKNLGEKTQTGDAEDDDQSDLDDAKLDALVDNDEEEDDLAEIDTSNIIPTGRRTRGKIIDYKKTAAELDNKRDAGDEKDDEEPEDADFKD